MSGVTRVRLGEVAQFIRGVTYKPKDVTTGDDPNAIPCMRTKNIQEDLEDDDLVYIPRSGIKIDKLIREGDILVSSANSWNLVGKCSWVPLLPYESTFGGFTSILRTTSDRVLPRYLYRWFATDSVQQLARSFGQQTTNISNLNQSRCLDLEIPLPPLPEQRRIAAILDKADALRRKRKRAIELLDSLTQSIFLEMFGDPKSNPRRWATRRLGEVANFYSGNSLPQGIPFEGQSGGYLLLKVSDLNADGNSEQVESAASWSAKPGSRAGTCLNSAVIFPKRGGAIATNKKRKLFRPAILDPNLMAVEPHKDSILIDYMFAWFQTFRLEEIASGSSVPQLNKQDLEPLEICVPPAEMQERFSNICQTLSGQIEMQKASYTEQISLFASLQHRAFSGQL